MFSRLWLPHPRFAASIGEFPQEFLLFGIEVFRYGDRDLDVVVATAVLGPQDRYAFAADAEDRPRLGAGRDGQLDLAVQGFDEDLRPQGSLGEGNRFLGQDVVAFTGELGIAADEDIDVQIAVTAAADARFAFTGYAQACAVVDAGRDLDLQFLADLDRPCAMAFLALVMDDLACAAAAGTGADIDHLAERRVLDDALLACAVAVRASIYLASRFGTVAVAVIARFFFRDLDFHFRTKGSLFKGNVYVEAQIGTALRAIGRLTAALAAEEGIKDIFKAAEALAALAESAKAAKTSEAALAKTGTGTGSIAVLECCRTELVVLGAFLFIRQDAVRFVDFLEFFFCCLRVVRVAVRMVFER